MEDILMNAGITTSGVAILLIVYRIFKYSKGHLLVSRCCGRKVEIGFDVKDVIETPKEEVKMTVNPIIVTK